MVPLNTSHTLLAFCKDVASGMQHLAGKSFVHRDLAARNILVAGDKTCKVWLVSIVLLWCGVQSLCNADVVMMSVNNVDITNSR